MIDPTNPLPFEQQAQNAHKKRTRRGRRSRGGKGPKGSSHHEDAKGHMAKAHAAASPHTAHKHLFNALSSLKKARAETPMQENA